MPIVQRRAKRALDLAAATGTIGRRGRRLHAEPRGLTIGPVRLVALSSRDGAGAPGGASARPEPGAGSAGRGAAGTALMPHTGSFGDTSVRGRLSSGTG